MAIPTVGAVGTATSGQAVDLTPTNPAHAANSILLCFVESTRHQDTLSCATTGWAEVADSPQFCTGAQNENKIQLAMFWKRAAGAAEANPTISGFSNQGSAVVIAFSGCRTSGSPWDVTSGGSSAGVASTSVSVTGDTTTVADCLVVIAVATTHDGAGTAQFSGWANADLASVTERFDQTFSTGLGGGLGIATGTKAVAGAYGATTVTTANAAAVAFMTVALSGTAVTTATVDLAWTDMADIEDGFKVERSDDGAAYAQIATPAANATTYQDTVNTGHTYAYRVRSYNANGNSPYSNISTVVIP